MNSRDEDTHHEDGAELLLPWYVSGRLSAGDRRRVETWLEEAPEARDHLARAMEESDLAIEAAEQLGAPSAASLDRLMAALEAQGGRAGPAEAGLAERLWAMLSPRYAFAAAAALCLVVLGQGVALTIMSQQQPATFQTASGETATATGPSALVAFADDASLAAVGAELARLDLVIVDGPAPGGILTVMAPDTEEGRSALAELGANSALVAFFSLRE